MNYTSHATNQKLPSPRKKCDQCPNGYFKYMTHANKLISAYKTCD